MRWTDDHCHLSQDPARAAEEIAAAAELGVERMVTVGCDVGQSIAYQALAVAHPGVVWATAGVHPHDSKDGIEGLEALLGEPGVVAVGECGLDYHYDHSPREVQREVFAAQIALAHAHDLALVIHTREAWDDTFAILEAEGVPERTVFHCFSGGPDEARRGLDLGAHLSFSGIVSFPSADDLRAAAALCPPRPAAGRDRQPVPGAGAAPRQEEPAGVGAARRRRRGRGERRAGRGRGRGDVAERRCRLPPRGEPGSGAARLAASRQHRVHVAHVAKRLRLS